MLQMKKGQTSAEYVILLAVSIIFFLIIIIVAYGQFANMGQVKSRDISVNSLKQIAEAAKEVYLQGSGARKTVVVTFPPEVEDNSIVITNNSLHLKHAGTDISIPIDFPIYGNLPTEAGTYEIILVSEGNQVRVGTAEFSVTPSSITFSFCQSNSSQASAQNLTFTNLQNYSINLSLAVDWTQANITLGISNSSLHLVAYGSQIVAVSTTLGVNMTGTYSGFITTNSSNTTTAVPVTVTTLDCTCYGTGAGANVSCTNVSYIRIKTYSNNSYVREKVAFDLPPNATITTGNWTANSTITLDIKDPSSNSVSGYPKNVQANSSGGYSEQWPVIGSYGTYTLIVNDSSISVNKIIQVTSCQ